MSWQIDYTSIERLREGHYPEIDALADVVFDIQPHRDDLLGKLYTLVFRAKSYRLWSRVLATRDRLLIYEYKLMGGFDIYSIPIREIASLTLENSECIKIKGTGGEYAELRANNQPKEIVHRIEALRAAEVGRSGNLARPMLATEVQCPFCERLYFVVPDGRNRARVLRADEVEENASATSPNQTPPADG
jgi:hypothetical protein